MKNYRFHYILNEWNFSKKKNYDSRTFYRVPNDLKSSFYWWIINSPVSNFTTTTKRLNRRSHMFATWNMRENDVQNEKKVFRTFLAFVESKNTYTFFHWLSIVCNVIFSWSFSLTANYTSFSNFASLSPFSHPIAYRVTADESTSQRKYCWMKLEELWENSQTLKKSRNPEISRPHDVTPWLWLVTMKWRKWNL